MKKILLIFLLIPLFFIYGSDTNSFPLTFGPFFVLPNPSKNDQALIDHNQKSKIEKEKNINIKLKSSYSKKPVFKNNKEIKKYDSVNYQPKGIIENIALQAFQYSLTIFIAK